MNFKYIICYICLLISSYTFGQVNQKINLTDTTFKVFGVCEQCKDRIEGALKLKGLVKPFGMLMLNYYPYNLMLKKSR